MNNEVTVKPGYTVTNINDASSNNTVRAGWAKAGHLRLLHITSQQHPSPYVTTLPGDSSACRVLGPFYPLLTPARRVKRDFLFWLARGVLPRVF